MNIFTHAVISNVDHTNIISNLRTLFTGTGHAGYIESQWSSSGPSTTDLLLKVPLSSAQDLSYIHFNLDDGTSPYNLTLHGYCSDNGAFSGTNTFDSPDDTYLYNNSNYSTTTDYGYGTYYTQPTDASSDLHLFYRDDAFIVSFGENTDKAFSVFISYDNRFLFSDLQFNGSTYFRFNYSNSSTNFLSADALGIKSLAGISLGAMSYPPLNSSNEKIAVPVQFIPNTSHMSANVRWDGYIVLLDKNYTPYSEVVVKDASSGTTITLFIVQAGNYGSVGIQKTDESGAI